MADTTTTNYSLTKPEVGASEDTWGTKLNSNLDTIDSQMKSISDAAAAAQSSANTALAKDPTLTLSGDVTGSATFTNLGNATLTATVGNNSHTHNGTTIDDNSISAAELNVSGNGTTSQYLRSDGDGSFTWATPPDTTANQTITLTGDASGSGTTSIAVTVANDSHSHSTSTITGLGSLATLSAVGAAQITDNSVGAAELNVSGNGTAGQALLSDGDGTMTWGSAGVDYGNCSNCSNYTLLTNKPTTYSNCNALYGSSATISLHNTNHSAISLTRDSYGRVTAFNCNCVCNG